MKRKNYYVIGTEATIFEEVCRICVKHHLNAAIRKAKKLYYRSDKYLDIVVVDSNGKILYSSFYDMIALGCSYDGLSASEFKSLYLSKREIVDPYKISNNHECDSDLPKELDWYTNILSSKEYLQATCNHRTPDGTNSLVYDNETGVARCTICGYEFKPIDPDSLREEEN
jgi:hypothetical protein